MANLRDVAISAFATQALESETYANMALWFQERRAASTSVGEIARSLKDVENEMKKTYSVTAMPAAWRSSKSVLCKALQLGVPIVDDTGKALGKTDVEKRCKAEVAATKLSDPTDPADEDLTGDAIAAIKVAFIALDRQQAKHGDTENKRLRTKHAAILQKMLINIYK